MSLTLGGYNFFAMYEEPISLIPRGHACIDARSLALGELIARRLRERPELLCVGRSNLARWRQTCAPNTQALLAEWQAILDSGLDATVAVLTGWDERCVRLRQSTPFAGEGIITRQERNALWRQFAP